MMSELVELTTVGRASRGVAAAERMDERGVAAKSLLVLITRLYLEHGLLVDLEHEFLARGSTVPSSSSMSSYRSSLKFRLAPSLKHGRLRHPCHLDSISP
eukprot:751572-Hanusia_phi.AAC.2